MWELLKVETRKALPWWAPFAAGLTLYLVTRRETLVARDVTLFVLSAAMGAAMAWIVFSDPGGSRSFMLSRPVSRGRLFLVRWGIGLGLLAATVCVALAALGSGLRGAWQTRIHYSVFYPTIRWGETDALWTITLFSLLTYHLGMFVRVRGDLLGERFLPPLAYYIGVCIMTGFLFPVIWEPLEHVGNPSRTLALMVAGVALVTTLSSLHLFKKMEVSG